MRKWLYKIKQASSGQFATRYLQFIGLVVVLIVGVGMWRTEQHANCQAGYNEINNIRSRAINDAITQERDSERRADAAQVAADEALHAILKAALLGESAEERRRLAEAYDRALAIELSAFLQQEQERHEADEARRNNPIPPPPSELCS